MKRFSAWFYDNPHLSFVVMVLICVLVSLFAIPAFGQVSLTIDGKAVTKATIVITTDANLPPPTCPTGQVLIGTSCVCPAGSAWTGSVCAITAPPTPPVTGYTVLPAAPIYWPTGGSPNTVGPGAVKTQATNTIQPYSVFASVLFGAGTKAFLSLYENSHNLKVNISATPGDMGSFGGLNPYFVAGSGNDGIRFASSDDPVSNSALSGAGWKRTPAFPSGMVYINVQADGPANYTLLYGPQ